MVLRIGRKERHSMLESRRHGFKELRNLLVLPDGSSQLTNGLSFIASTLAIMDRDLIGGYLISETGLISKITGISGYENPTLILKARSRWHVEVVHVTPILDTILITDGYSSVADAVLSIYQSLSVELTSKSRRVVKHAKECGNLKEFFEGIEAFLTYY